MEKLTLFDFAEGFIPPRSLVILGAGHFGEIALRRLSKKFPDADTTIVDSLKEKRYLSIEGKRFAILNQDAVEFLINTPMPDDAWIVPAVPVHVAYQWIRRAYRDHPKRFIRPVEVPEDVDRWVLNPYRVPGGTVYSSIASFICPDACIEPEKMCPYTKSSREWDLFERIAQIPSDGFDLVVFRSFQLAPGVGGYPALHLKKALDFVDRKSGAYLIATSCRCHGVIDAFTFVRL